MQNLFTPWRYAYLSGARKGRGCLFCRARDAADDASLLVVRRGTHNFVILNRYPYNSGHLMIVPNRHIGSLARGRPEELHEMMSLARLCERALQAAYRMDGMNLGMNLGSSAGAGVLEHFHLHLVPRWAGDTNFMTVVGKTRVTPELLEDTYRKLHRLLAERRGGARKPRAPRRLREGRR